MMYYNMKKLPGEKNWYNGVKKLLETYKITMSEEEIKSKSKDVFKAVVKKAIVETALADLTEECSKQKKTNTLTYTKLKPQNYLTKL